ncbi:unnamed protein product [Rhizoctonia solani]|uniref:Uncharacterized protein n=1 Tax=Rhizoctonia solani TaxID=456999 RepID=A0A8H2XX48_9AGAM|nr:unnamed protein product [Rhizoctonia solani]
MPKPSASASLGSSSNPYTPSAATSPSPRRSTSQTPSSPSGNGSSHAKITSSSSPQSRTRWKPPPDRARLILDIFLNYKSLPLEIIHIILNYASYYCRTHERRLGTISVNAPMFAQLFFSRSNGSLLYLRSPVLGHRPLQKIVFVMQHEVSFPWAESSSRTAGSPCAWFEAARYRRMGRRHSIPPPKLRFATAHPVSSEWEEVPNTREILRFDTGRNSTSLNYMNSTLVSGMQPGEKVGVLVIAGRGTNVKHVIREMVIYLFCSW